MVNNFQDPIIFSTYIKLCMKENGFKKKWVKFPINKYIFYFFFLGLTVPIITLFL